MAQRSCMLLLHCRAYDCGCHIVPANLAGVDLFEKIPGPAPDQTKRIKSMEVKIGSKAAWGFSEFRPDASNPTFSFRCKGFVHMTPLICALCSSCVSEPRRR